MKSIVRILALFLPVAAAQAEDGGDAPGVLLGSDGASGLAQTCVEVMIGDERTSGLDCVNQQLQQEVARVRPPQNIAPVGPGSPAVEIGGFNQTALRQQYGPNLGRSVEPYRPTPQYGSPMQPLR